MTILKIPTEVAVSPEDACGLRYCDLTGHFYDELGNTFLYYELVGTRQWNAIEKWLHENFPKGD